MADGKRVRRREPRRPRTGAIRRVLRALGTVAVVAVLAAVAVVAWDWWDQSERAPGVGEGPRRDSRTLMAAACRHDLTKTTGPAITEPLVTEASGVAPVRAVDGRPARTWLINDSGNAPRLYGVDGDGEVQVVDVTGAESVDWEDLAVAGDHLWIADTGANASNRDAVQLYRVPIPGPGDTQVAAVRTDVTYPEATPDVEAVAVAPDGTAHLLTKELGRSRIFRVDVPDGGGAAEARQAGEMRTAPGPLGLVTGAALAPDGGSVLVRTYAGAWIYPVEEGTEVPAALAASGRRCRIRRGAEVQGEAIGYQPGGRGYVTIGEGANPRLSSYRARD